MDRIMVLWMQKAIEPSFHNGAVPNHHCFTANEKINNPLGLYCVYGDPNMTIPEVPPPNFLKFQMEAWEWKKLPNDDPLAKNLIREKMEALFTMTAKLKDPSIRDYCDLRVDCWLVVDGSEEEIENRTAQMAEVFRNRSNGFKVKIDRNRSFLHGRAYMLMELEDSEWI
jgi:hypothetical protein